MRNFLSPKEVALAVGVSESSLKRWADSGRVKVRRTAGGHRRISIQEAIRFARENGFPIVRPDVLDLPEVSSSRTPSGESFSLNDVMYEKLSQGAAEDVRAMLLELYLAGRPLTEVFDGPFRDAMKRIGESWRHGESGIYVEHRATDICIQAVTMVRSLISGGTELDQQDRVGRPIAVGGAPANDPYTLPSLMVATVLADLGFHEVNLGPETPMRAMIAAAQHYRPSLVWLSCSVVDAVPSEEELASLASAIGDWDGRLMLGGRGFDQRPPLTSKRVRHVASLGMLAHHAREIVPEATQGPSGGSKGRFAGRGPSVPASSLDIEVIE
jgi:methanogenic corrinoid protein MtbC1